MPTRQDHLHQAEHNERLSDLLATTEYTDWVVTTIFYAALQLVDAYLLTQGMNPKDHQERLLLVSRLPPFAPIWRHYRTLLDRSIDARYECFAFNASQVQSLRERSFAPLKQHIHRLLNT